MKGAGYSTNAGCVRYRSPNVLIPWGCDYQFQNADLVCRGTWARVTIDQFRHSAFQNV